MASGIAIALGGSSADLNTVTTAVSTIAGAVTALTSIVTYIRAEEKIGAAIVEAAQALWIPCRVRTKAGT